MYTHSHIINNVARYLFMYTLERDTPEASSQIEFIFNLDVVKLMSCGQCINQATVFSSINKLNVQHDNCVFAETLVNAVGYASGEE